MGKTIDILRSAFDEINIAFDKQIQAFNLQGKVFDETELTYIQLHKEMPLLLNVKRPNINLIASKMAQIKALEPLILEKNKLTDGLNDKKE